MVKKLGGILLLGILLVSFASAEIFISQQPKSSYNIGDELSFTIGSDGTEELAVANLVCGNSSKMIYYNFFAKNTDEAKVNVPLKKIFLRDLIGQCHLSLVSGEVIKESFEFEISDKININFQFDDKEFNPNDTVSFSGKTSKINQERIDGFAEIGLDEIGLETIVPITKNVFIGEFLLPENVPAGDYILGVFAYEKDENGEVTNGGGTNVTITITQQPRNLGIEVPAEVNPNDEVQFTVILYDQTGRTMDNFSASVKISDVNGESMLDKLTGTGDANYLLIKKNAPYGYWNISAESEGLNYFTTFYVNKNKEAEFAIVNNTLIVRNIGNVPYDKLIEIGIGNHSEVKGVNISVGHSIGFELSAPDGEYEISIDDGSSLITQSGVALTGNAIAISDLKKAGLIGVINKSSVVWVFLIMVLGMFLFVASRRMLNKRMVLSSDNFSIQNNKTEPKKIVKLNSSPENAIMPPINSSGGVASHSLVLSGEKQKSALIAIKIKNTNELKKIKSNAFDTINEASKEVSENGGRVYKAGDFVVGIFAPVVTRTFDNAFTSVKVAKAISDKLNNHNSKFVHKIDFGIGVGIGDIVAKKEKDGNLSFTPLGSCLANAKKIAEMADNDVLINEELQKAVIPQVKVIANPSKFGIKTYSIGEITDRGQNKKFINSFLDRNPDYKKLGDFRK